MKKTILGLVLAGAAYLFPSLSSAQEEEEPDHKLVCEQQFQSLLEKTVDEFSNGLPGKQLQNYSKEILWGIIQKRYEGKPLEQMLDSWRAITVQELSEQKDVEDEMSRAVVSLRSAYQDECLTEELKKWRTRDWLKVKDKVYTMNISEICGSDIEEITKECERGRREGIITPEDYAKSPLETCPFKGRKNDECFDLFNPAIKVELLKKEKAPRIDEPRIILDGQRRRRPYILTPQVNEKAQSENGIVSWDQDFTGEDKHSRAGTKLRCSGDTFSSISITDYTLKDRSKFRASVEVKDITWSSDKVGYYNLTCVAYEKDRLSLPYTLAFQFDGMAKKNPREIFHSINSLEALFSHEAQGRFKSDNKLAILPDDATRLYIVVDGFIQLGKKTAEEDVLREGEFFSGLEMAAIEKFRTSPFGLALQVGYSSRLNGLAGSITIEGNELLNRDFQYQLSYKANLSDPLQKYALESTLEMVIGKLNPWERPHLAAWGFFVNARGNLESLQAFSAGPKIRTPLVSKYSTHVELKLGYHLELLGEKVAHSIVPVVSFEF